MNAITLKPDGFALLPDEDRAVVQGASRVLSQAGKAAGVRLQVGEGEAAQTFALPDPAVRLLAEMLELLGQGRSVVVMHDSAELTTQQAADMLHVSRPYVVKLLEDGALPFHMVGTHRRVDLRDLLAFKRAHKKKARAALKELVEQAQELDMGY